MLKNSKTELEAIATRIMNVYSFGHNWEISRNEDFSVRSRKIQKYDHSHPILKFIYFVRQNHFMFIHTRIYSFVREALSHGEVLCFLSSNMFPV